jgi:hypothetical protein
MESNRIESNRISGIPILYIRTLVENIDNIMMCFFDDMYSIILSILRLGVKCMHALTQGGDKRGLEEGLGCVPKKVEA